MTPYTHLKRALDLILSIILIISLSWLWVLIILSYLLTFQFPIFFIQERIGKNERPFNLIKFRTLKNGEGPIQSRKNFMGNLLRRTSLDELPQLWNVMKGEMSLVGPRPLPVQYLPLFSPEQRRRHSIRPGITGLAQVNGRHGISWEEKFSYDLYYVQHVSFLYDVHIMAMTVGLLFSFKRDVSLEEKAFTGK
ncbi:MAG TPA: sugar transferase [Cyclobacteriaceae bacterium]|nr:sugar transferase [Cyclobacteriaceae bacterium]